MRQLFRSAALPLLLLLAGRASADTSVGTELFVAAAAHAPGLGGSFFATDLRIGNPSDAAVVARVAFVPPDGTISAEITVPVAARGSAALDDLLLSRFGLDRSVGGLRIRADRPIEVTSRTYNVTATGTFGQLIPGRPASEALGVGARAALLHGGRTSIVRTNVGMLNVSDAPAIAHVTLWGADGDLLGSTELTAAANGWTQLNDPFSKLGIESAPNATVRLEVSAGSVLAYASVIDGSTNDPSYVEPAVERAADGVAVAETRLAADAERTFRGALELGFVAGDLDRVVAWDQVYEGTGSAGVGCTSLLDLRTEPGLAVPLAGDGSFATTLGGSGRSVTLSGVRAPDGSVSGTFTVVVDAGSCRTTGASGTFGPLR